MIAVRSLLVTACLLVLGACDGRSTLPGRLDDAWYEVSGPHFTVLTDLDRDDAIATALELERLLAAYLTVGWSAGDWPEQLTVVVLSDGDDVEDFRPESRGFYVTNALLEPLAVTPARTLDDQYETLKHELTHHIAYASMAHQPPWYAEGIATFFQTARFDQEGRFVLGLVPRDLHRTAAWQGVLPAHALLDPRADTTGPRFYSSAWLLVHYLMMRRGDAFTAYQRALIEGASFEQAWQRAFPELSPELLDRELAQYLERGAYTNYAVEVTLPQAEVKARPLRDADVHALYALIYASSRSVSDWEARARRELDQALQLDPHNARGGLVRLAYVMPADGQRLAAARAITAQHPEQWLAWLMLSSLATEAGSMQEGAAALDRALALKPEQPIALSLAAERALRAGDRDQALRLTARALHLSPFTPAVVASRATVLVHTGEQEHGCQLLRDSLARPHGQAQELEPVWRALCESPAR